jgi:hypothetical protein
MAGLAVNAERAGAVECVMGRRGNSTAKFHIQVIFTGNVMPERPCGVVLVEMTPRRSSLRERIMQGFL